jgi:hypothetical protein
MIMLLQKCNKLKIDIYSCFIDENLVATEGSLEFPFIIFDFETVSHSDQRVPLSECKTDVLFSTSLTVIYNFTHQDPRNEQYFLLNSEIPFDIEKKHILILT